MLTINETIERIQQIIQEKEVKEEFKKDFDFTNLIKKIKTTTPTNMHDRWNDLILITANSENIRKYKMYNWFQRILSLIYNKPISQIQNDLGI